MKIKIITLAILSFITTLGSSEIFEERVTTNNEANGIITYSIKKQTLSSGGGAITGGIYSVTSSMGQIDAGHNATAGVYEFKGGFLTENSDLIFKHGFD